MKIYERKYQKLIEEFSKIEVEIEYGEKSYPDADNLVDKDDEVHGPQFDIVWPFTLVFNKNFRCNSYMEDPGKEYLSFLDDERNKFYEEIKTYIEEEENENKILVELHDIKLRFEDVKLFYYVAYEANRKKRVYNKDIYSHSRISIIKNDDKKHGRQLMDERIISIFLEIQIDSIIRIEKYLESKIEFLEKHKFVSDSIDEKISGRKLIPIEKLDRYQTALIFSYLRDVGAIKDKSSNSISPIISRLTGHSENTLRNKGFDKIWQIKAGKEGNKTKLLTEPDYNLKKVKNIILEILSMVNDDLKKNESNRNK